MYITIDELDKLNKLNKLNKDNDPLLDDIVNTEIKINKIENEIVRMMKQMENCKTCNNK